MTHYVYGLNIKPYSKYKLENKSQITCLGFKWNIWFIRCSVSRVSNDHKDRRY